MEVVMQESPLRRFMDDAALVTDLEERSSADGRFVVNLMTIHASKRQGIRHRLCSGERRRHVPHLPRHSNGRKIARAGGRKTTVLRGHDTSHDRALLYVA